MAVDEINNTNEAPGDDFANTAGFRNDDGKLRYDLIPPEVETALAEVLTAGSRKYPDRNWEQGMTFMRVFASMRRHLNAWARREDIDNDIGLNHMKLALCNAAFLVTYIERGMEHLDDRPVVDAYAPPVTSQKAQGCDCDSDRNYCSAYPDCAAYRETVKLAREHTGYPYTACTSEGGSSE